MKIGIHELNEEDSAKANAIISEFFGTPCSIIEGDTSYNNGRSFVADKQYRLNINGIRHVGIKLKYDVAFRHENEFLVRDIRVKIGVSNTMIKKIRGFPMDGQKWRDTDCLISDWGPMGQREDLQTLLPSVISHDKTIFLEELGKVSAFSYALGLWDRRPSNFVWDKNEKKMISIDHEALVDDEIDVNITASLSNVIVKFFGANWYADKDLKLTFESGFNTIWAEMVRKRAEIADIYDVYTKGKKELFMQRIFKSSAIPLGLIMMQ